MVSLQSSALSPVKLAAKGTGGIRQNPGLRTLSFPRKRESTSQSFGDALSSDWIPAFAGMTGGLRGTPFQMTPVAAKRPWPGGRVGASGRTTAIAGGTQPLTRSEVIRWCVVASITRGTGELGALTRHGLNFDGTKRVLY
jgi:hypothetical protein